jgi:hypothetical protein
MVIVLSSYRCRRWCSRLLLDRCLHTLYVINYTNNNNINILCHLTGAGGGAGAAGCFLTGAYTHYMLSIIQIIILLTRYYVISPVPGVVQGPPFASPWQVPAHIIIINITNYSNINKVLSRWCSWELTISPNILCLFTLDNNTTIFSLSPEDV